MLLYVGSYGSIYGPSTFDCRGIKSLIVNRKKKMHATSGFEMSFAIHALQDNQRPRFHPYRMLVTGCWFMILVGPLSWAYRRNQAPLVLRVHKVPAKTRLVSRSAMSKFNPHFLFAVCMMCAGCGLLDLGDVCVVVLRAVRVHVLRQVNHHAIIYYSFISICFSCACRE